MEATSAIALCRGGGLSVLLARVRGRAARVVNFVEVSKSQRPRLYKTDFSKLLQKGLFKGPINLIEK